MNPESSTFPGPMATSSEKDEHSEPESAESTNESDETQPDGAEQKAASSEASEKAAAAGDKGSAFAKSTKGAGNAKPARAGAKRGTKPARSKIAGAPPPAPARKPAGSLGKSVVLFVAIVGGLATAFVVFNNGDGGGGRVAPNWKVGQQVDVEITLVKTDKDDLACASADEISGKHCAFEGQNKKWSKGDSTNDKTLLRPYTTTSGSELLAAGLWSEPALSGTLPALRFSVKCKYTVEGKVKKPSIRWATDKPWFDNNGEWFSGFVSGCTLLP